MRSAFLLAASFVLLVACGDDGAPPTGDAGGDAAMTSACPGPGCVISGTVTTCMMGYACTIPADGSTVQCGEGSTCVGMCGDSCNIECTGGATCEITTGNSTSSECDQSTCVITAGESASYDCTNGADCDVTAGAGSSLTCDGISTCDFVCTSTCSAQCLNESTCTIQCPSDEAPRSFDGEVSCE